MAYGGIYGSIWWAWTLSCSHGLGVGDFEEVTLGGFLGDFLIRYRYLGYLGYVSRSVV